MLLFNIPDPILPSRQVWEMTTEWIVWLNAPTIIVIYSHQSNCANTSIVIVFNWCLSSPTNTPRIAGRAETKSYRSVFQILFSCPKFKRKNKPVWLCQTGIFYNFKKSQNFQVYHIHNLHMYRLTRMTRASKEPDIIIIIISFISFTLKGIHKRLGAYPYPREPRSKGAGKPRTTNTDLRREVVNQLFN